jgi:hypothetical protein
LSINVILWKLEIDRQNLLEEVLSEKLSKDNLCFGKMEDPFQNFPLDITCEIISNLTSLEDIITYRTTSKIFNEVSKSCLENVNANVPTYVPLVFFADHPHLQRLGDQIYLKVTPKSLEILTTIPSLRAANLYLGKLANENFGDAILLILDLLNVGRKLPQVNFRIAAVDENGSLLLFFLQNYRFMLYPNDRPELADKIQRQYPDLSYFNFEDLSPYQRSDAGFTRLRLMSDKLRRFLIEGNFGLVDPTQPPSPENPPLSEYTKLLAEGGLIGAVFITPIFIIYIAANQLKTPTNPTVWTPDELINELFYGDLVQAQNEYLAKGKRPIDLDNLLFAHISTIAGKNTRPTKENFGEYDIPNWGPDKIMNSELYDTILQIVSQTRRNWNTVETEHRRGLPFQYYDVNGNLITI